MGSLIRQGMAVCDIVLVKDSERFDTNAAAEANEHEETDGSGSDSDTEFNVSDRSRASHSTSTAGEAGELGMDDDENPDERAERRKLTVPWPKTVVLEGAGTDDDIAKWRATIKE